MHRAIAAWLIAKPWRASIAAAILGTLSPEGLSPISVAAGAIPVLLLLSRDVRSGLNAAVAGCAAAGALMIASGQSVLLSLACVVLLFLTPLALAQALQKTGSLRWCFQLAVVGASVLLIVLYAIVDDPVERWQEWLREAAHAVTQSGIALDEQAILKSLSTTNWGTYIALWLLTVLGSLFWGCWWHSLLFAPGAFGKEFQQLRLGKLLGTLAVLTVVAAFVLDRSATGMPLIEALLWIATIALACQGLAAAHRLKATGRVGRGWLTATYVLLIVPVTMVFMVMLLAGWGVADNWRRHA